MGKSDLGARISQRTIFQIYINSNYTFFAILYLREGVYSEKTFLNGHCLDRSYPPGQWAMWSFFGRQKRHLSAYYQIKFQLISIMKMINMMMILVIVVMLMMMTMTKNQTTTMTLT